MAGWPSAAERRELGAYPAQAGPEDVKGFFELSPDDLRFVLSHHRDAQLGVTVALCSLRWLGFVPDDLGELPRPALLELCEQLEADPDDVVVYGTRAQTRSDHFLTIRDRAGFRAFDAEQREAFEGWLVSRAMEHERPKPLHALACEHLHASRVVRPGVDALVRMIATARDRAHAATFDALEDQFTPVRVGGLDGLLVLREAASVTLLEWLRTPAADGAAGPINGQIDKLCELQALSADLIELSMLPPGRVRILAGEARRRSAWELSRLRWSGNPDMRQRSHGQLNKGESANAMRREVGYGNRGRVRAQDPEQLHRHMEARRLVANAIGYWNARYIALAYKQLERDGRALPDHEVRRVHYMHHEHVNFFGRHTVDLRHGPPKGKHRPLRPQPAARRIVATTATTNETATNR